MLAGQEVIAPCMVDGNKEDLHNRRAKIQRLKVSLKLQDYNPKRDFVGWGGEDFRRLLGMAGFTHISPVGRVDPEAQAISVVDFDGDGKQDLCLVGGEQGHAPAKLRRSDERICCSRASPAPAPRSGPTTTATASPISCWRRRRDSKLFTNLGTTMRDDSHLLPPMPPGAPTAAAWLDYDGDGKPDLLVANGYHGLRLYRNVGVKAPAAPKAPKLGKWQHIGPLDNAGSRGFNYGPPLRKENRSQGRICRQEPRKIRWQEKDFPDGAVNDLLPPTARSRNWAACCLYREIEVDTRLRNPRQLRQRRHAHRLAQRQEDHRRPQPPRLRARSEQGDLEAQGGQEPAPHQNLPGRRRLGVLLQRRSSRRLPVPAGQAFEDVSEKVGLGANGIGANLKGDSLTVCDVNGDGRPDFLYGAGNGHARTGRQERQGGADLRRSQRLRHRRSRRARSTRSSPTSTTTAIPIFWFRKRDRLKLFKNDGKGRFTDVTAKSGDLAKFTGWATSAAWGDVDNDGHLDLVVGCLKGPNRYFRNKGDGTFEDATEAIGLHQKIFNTQAVSLVDLQNRGVLDFIFNNEGQDSVVLLGEPDVKPASACP